MADLTITDTGRWIGFVDENQPFTEEHLHDPSDEWIATFAWVTRLPADIVRRMTEAERGDSEQVQEP